MNCCPVERILGVACMEVKEEVQEQVLHFMQVAGQSKWGGGGLVWKG